MFDILETIDHSLIQHGPSSNRIYLMKAAKQDLPALLDTLDALAEAQQYSKIFAKIAAPLKPFFERYGYLEEAAVPNFYNGRIDGLFLGKYIDPQRELDPTQKQIEANIDLAEQKSASSGPTKSSPPYTFRALEQSDAVILADLYKTVFASYPFPIHQPEYIIETMASHIEYFGAFDGQTLIAASSAEMDTTAQNAEMTDFATLPDYRGKGLAQHLLGIMEAHMRANGIKTGYTIARALSAGMNITFARFGYHFAGTLTNNTDICGKIESMNVWYKALDPSPASTAG